MKQRRSFSNFLFHPVFRTKEKRASQCGSQIKRDNITPKGCPIPSPAQRAGLCEDKERLALKGRSIMGRPFRAMEISLGCDPVRCTGLGMDLPFRQKHQSSQRLAP